MPKKALEQDATYPLVWVAVFAAKEDPDQRSGDATSNRRIRGRDSLVYSTG